MTNFEEGLAALIGTHGAENADIEQITLHICCPLDGWMNARLKIGEETFPLLFSDVYPPFVNFRDWLFALIQNKPAPAVEVYDEYEHYYFNATSTDNLDNLVFEYLRHAYPGIGVYRKAVVTKRSLIEAFYLALKYLMSIDFEAAEQHFSRLSFNFDRRADDIICIDLSKIEAYLREQ